MNIVTSILTRVVAVEFYRRNVTFFLIVLLFSAGFMRSVDHLALAQYFTASPRFVSFPALVWILYLFYVLWCNTVLLRSRENTFIASFRLFPRVQQWRSSFVVATAQLAPVILYGSFLVTVSLQSHNIFTATMTMAILLLLLALATFAIQKRMSAPGFENDAGIFARWYFVRPNRRFSIFCIEWAVRRQPWLIAGFKVISMVLIGAALHLYRTDTYDIRLAGIATVFAFALNTNFVLAVHEFTNKAFPLYRQAPFPLLKRYSDALFTIFIFTLPELVLFLRNLPDTLSVRQGFLLYGFGLSINLLMFHYGYTRQPSTEPGIPFIYSFSVALFFCVLSGVPAGWLALGNTIVSGTILYVFYYRFDPSEPG